jgi:protein-tyrosine kinase
MFDMKNREGLTSALLEEEPVLNGLLRETEFENLRVLTSGPQPINPSELLGSEKMRQLVEPMKDEADIIIFDTPPNPVVTDASVLAMEADGVLLLAEAGKTRRAALQQAVEQLRQLGVRILGVVLNNVRVQRSSSYYYQYRQEPDEETGAGDE